MNKLIFLFPFFFLFLFIVPAYAYTDFNHNPTIDGHIGGFIAYNSVNSTYSYNASCGFNGCMQIDSDANSDHEIYALKGNNTFNYTDITAQLLVMPSYANTSMTITSNKEVIVFLRYMVNESLTTPAPMLYIYNQTLLYGATLNSTANIWHNFTAIVPYASVDKSNFRVYMTYSSDTPATRFLIDEFRVFSLDEIYAWDNTLTKADYCHFYAIGEIGTVWRDFDYTTNLEPYASYMTPLHNETGINATCIFFNQTLIIRRSIERADAYGDWLNGGTQNVVHSMYDITRDIWVLMEERYNSGDITWYGYNPLFVFGINSQYITAFGINCSALASPSDWCNNVFASGNDKAELKFTTLGDVYFYNISQGALNTLTNVPITSFNIVGSTVKAYGNHSDWTSNYYPFFYYVPSVRSYCEFNTLYSIIGYTTTELANCGSCGCASNGLSCNTGTASAYCLDAYNYVNNYVNCTSTYDFCSGGLLCYNVSSTTVGCYATYDDMINANVSSGSTDAYNNLITGVDPLTSMAIVVGSWFSITNTTTAKAIFSLLLTIVGAFTVSVALAIWGKVHGSTIAQIFIMTSMMLLVLFTTAGYFPTLLFVVMLILSAGILVKLFDIF